MYYTYFLDGFLRATFFKAFEDHPRSQEYQEAAVAVENRCRKVSQVG